MCCAIFCSDTYAYESWFDALYSRKVLDIARILLAMDRT